jgi:hypothetical protein
MDKKHASSMRPIGNLKNYPHEIKLIDNEIIMIVFKKQLLYFYYIKN